MPRSPNEKSTSPERISRQIRSRSAKPIDIPKRRRPTGDRSSPDLIFEMSPVSSDTHSNPSAVSSVEEPFMYHAPSLKPFPSYHLHYPKPTTTSRNLEDTFTRPESYSMQQMTTTLLPNNPNDNKHSAPQHGRSVSRIHQSTTKITGFVPVLEQQPMDDEVPKPKRPLIPPPRRPSYSSSSWMLPGKSDSTEKNCSYSQMDPSAFEFHNHLLRRMENRDSSRMKSLHSCL